MNSRASSSIRIAALAFSMAAAAHAVEIQVNEKTKIDVGGRFQITGHLQNITSQNNAHTATSLTYTSTVGTRDTTRIFLFQNQNRLRVKGELDGIKVWFEQTAGGEAMNGSNNQVNLLELNALVPVRESLSVMLGQFRVPSSRASAIYDRDTLFTAKSSVNNWFFNAGYDTGLAVNWAGEWCDAVLGTSLGTPNIPVRYLPVIFQLPPLLFTRIGVGTLKEDPYHPSDDPSDAVAEGAWAWHVNGQYIKDSNAGHSSLLGQPNGQITLPSVQSYYGNAFLSNNWNPFLGLRVIPNGPINQVYWNASTDFQYKKKLEGGLNLGLSAQVNYAQFINQDFAPINYNGQRIKWAQISATGAELAGSLMGERWGLAARADVVLPDPYFATKDSGGNYISILGSDPVYEVTFPSIIYKHGKYLKLVAETQFWLNAPEVGADSGMFELLDEVTQVTAANKNTPITHNPLVSMARLMAQVDF